MTPIQRIESLINSLPDKDVKLGKEFLKKRKFDNLKELIDSALHKIKNDLKGNRGQYENINIDSLNKLKLEVDSYITMLYPEEDLYGEEEFI